MQNSEIEHDGQDSIRVVIHVLIFPRPKPVVDQCPEAGRTGEELSSNIKIEGKIAAERIGLDRTHHYAGFKKTACKPSNIIKRTGHSALFRALVQLVAQFQLPRPRLLPGLYLIIYRRHRAATSCRHYWLTSGVSDRSTQAHCTCQHEHNKNYYS